MKIDTDLITSCGIEMMAKLMVEGGVSPSAIIAITLVREGNKIYSSAAYSGVDAAVIFAMADALRIMIANYGIERVEQLVESNPNWPFRK